MRNELDSRNHKLMLKLVTEAIQVVKWQHDTLMLSHRLVTAGHESFRYMSTPGSTGARLAHQPELISLRPESE